MKRSIARAVYRLEQTPGRLVLNGGERRRSSPMPPHRMAHALGVPRAHLPEASTSKNRSYMTLPTFQLPRVFEVA